MNDINLLKVVLGIEIDSIIDNDKPRHINNIVYDHDDFNEYKTISLVEFGKECKSWARKNGYEILTFLEWNEKTYEARLYETNDFFNLLRGTSSHTPFWNWTNFNNEEEAIFKATSYIINHLVRN